MRLHLEGVIVREIEVSRLMLNLMIFKLQVDFYGGDKQGRLMGPELVGYH